MQKFGEELFGEAFFLGDSLDFVLLRSFSV